MLVDNVTISIKAGNGGNGAATFRRNAQTAKGGPDGGNGGNGADIYFLGVDDITALRKFRFQKKIVGQDGIPGKKKNLFGKNAQTVIVNVPLGTRITDLSSSTTYEISDTTTPLLLARGGKGGRGNNEFKSAINQAPRYAEPGGKGETKQLFLELRIIADVGLIGLPNAGKSSLLKSLTNANPKIGSYPFTTLEPNLGRLENITLADIPGLIEGASRGKGLGIQFLKHIEKTKLLIHCVDSTSTDSYEDYLKVKNEITEYNEKLRKKEEIILLTKIDLLTPEQVKEKIALFKNSHQRILSFSIYDPETIDAFKSTINNIL